MKKTYITPQQHTVKVAPYNQLLAGSVQQQDLNTIIITIGSTDFNSSTDEML